MRLVGSGEHNGISARSAASESPEEIRVLLGVDDQQLTIGCQDGKLENVVDSPAQLRGKGSMASASG